MPLRAPGHPSARAPFALAAAWLLLLAAPEPARATCEPDPATDGDNVVCDSVLIDDPNGFAAGAGVDDLNVTVLGGSSVTNPAGDGISVNDDNLVTNDGTIDASANGIEGGDDNTVENNGSITAGANGIDVADEGSVTNNGTITAGGDGVQANDETTIVNGASGVIDAGDDGIDVFDESSIVNAGSLDAAEDGIIASDDNTISNSGTLTAGDEGMDLLSGNSINNSGELTSGSDGILASDLNTIINSGTIGANADGIDVDDLNSVINSDSISAVDDAISAQNLNTIVNLGTLDAGSDGIDVLDSNSVTNSGSIDAGLDGIAAGNSNTITNISTISAGDDGIDATNNNSITNSGSITALDDGVEMESNNTLTNNGTLNALSNGVNATSSNSITNSGSISAGIDGIDADDTNTITNIGTIDAVGANGIDVDDTNSIVNSGSIDAQLDAIQLTGSGNDVENTGTLTTATGDGIEAIDAAGANTILNNTTGVIDAGDNGISVSNFTTVTNAGAIDAGDDGIEANSNNLVENDGTIGANAPVGGQGVDAFGTDNVVTNTLTGVINSQLDGILAGDDSTVTNDGTITTTAATGDGIEGSANSLLVNNGTIDAFDDGIDGAGDGNTITNNGAIDAGFNGLEAENQNLVTNTGTIGATGAVGEDGIFANDDNTISNTGTIDAGEDGIDADGSGNTVTNEGSIAAGSDGLEASTQNELTNAASGVIDAVGDGIDVVSENTVTNLGSIDAGDNGIEAGSSNTIENSGTIGATAAVGGDGINADNANSILNSGSIDATDDGIAALDSSQSVRNTGTIDAGDDGIIVGNNNSVVVNSGVIGAGGNGMDGSDNNALTNSGTIDAGGDGMTAGNSNTLTNNGVIGDAAPVGDDGMSAVDGNLLVNNGTIDAGDDGVEVGMANTVDNNGTITAAGDGFDATAGANGGNLLTNDNLIDADFRGIAADDGANSITNNGTITAGTDGIEAAGANNSIVNTGSISAVGNGVEMVGSSISILTNIAGGTITGNVGVQIDGVGPNFVDNLGVISGTGAAAGCPAPCAIVGSNVVSPAGDDVENHSGGIINGNIQLNAGDDSLTLETSSTLNNVTTDGGAGTDDILLRGTTVGTYDGRFVAFEELLKTDSGTWNLNGGTLAMPSEVDESVVEDGRLNVNGVLQGNVRIDGPGAAPGARPDGTLGGTGTVLGTVTGNGGTVSPGLSIGTLTVSQYDESAPSTHDMEIDALGNNDLLNVTGTHMLFAPPSSTLFVTALPGDYLLGAQIYDIVIAAGGRSGTFDPANHTLVGTPTKLYLEYQPDRIRLTSIPLDFGGLGETPNQMSVGDYLDDALAFEICESDLCFVAKELGLSDDIPGGLDQLHPELYDAYVTLTQSQARIFSEVYQHRIGEVRRTDYGTRTTLHAPGLSSSYQIASSSPTLYAAAGDPVPSGARPGQAGIVEGAINLWVRGVGGGGTKDNTTKHVGFDYSTGGLVAGFDFHPLTGLIVGAMGTWQRSDLDWEDRGGDGDADLAMGGIYGSYFTDRWYIDTSLGYGRSWFDTDRTIRFGLVDRKISSDNNADVLSVRSTAGYLFEGPWALQLEPTLSLDYVHVRVDGFTEDDGGDVALFVSDHEVDSLRLHTGARVSKVFETERGWTLIPEVRAAWIRELLDDSRDLEAGFVGLASTFKVNGDAPGANQLGIGTGITVFFNDMVSVYGGYSGEVRNDLDNHTGTVGVRLRF